MNSKANEMGARMGAFGEWEVPLYFSSIIEEHEAVRERAGLFDISHMGQIRVTGAAARDFLEHLLPRKVSSMDMGRALYMPLLNEKAGIIDDIIVYRQGDDDFFIIVNASNAAKDYEWVSRQITSYDARADHLSEAYGLLALQGPKALSILERAIPGIPAMKYYAFSPYEEGFIARTGYTGEDGVEILALKEKIPAIWQQLMAAGESDGLVPIGFGARDTLRLEAGMLLHGHDMNESVTPMEAGIGWAVDLTKQEFIGSAVLREQAKGNLTKKLIGFEMIDRGIPREGYAIIATGESTGTVTSGSFAPKLQKNIGLGYVKPENARPDNEINIEIRGRELKARVVPLPFYRRKKS